MLPRVKQECINTQRLLATVQEIHKRNYLLQSRPLLCYIPEKRWHVDEDVSMWREKRGSESREEMRRGGKVRSRGTEEREKEKPLTSPRSQAASGRSTERLPSPPLCKDHACRKSPPEPGTRTE